MTKAHVGPNAGSMLSDKPVSPHIHTYTPFGQMLLEKERRAKIEIAIVATLWLAGCPLLCWLLDTNDSLYGTTTDELCGLVQYSISSSMTGHYSKILGSVLTPLFAVLVVQRTSGGLCSHMKLHLLSTRCSQTPHVGGGDDSAGQFDDSNAAAAAAAATTITTPLRNITTARDLWNHIVKIELLGYFAGASLIALVAFDSKNFEWTHNLLASIAFFLLGQQNRMIGRLGQRFPTIFVDWHNPVATVMFYWGFLHLGLMYTGFFFLGTLQDRGRCDMVGNILGPNAEPNVAKCASALFWANEYVFVFLCTSLQLLRYYEYRIWEIVGEDRMLYASILSKYSCFSAFDLLFRGGTKEASVLFGADNNQKLKFR